MSILGGAGEIVLITDWCSKAQSTVGVAIPRKMVLNHTRKLTEYTPGPRKPSNKWRFPWFLLCFSDGKRCTLVRNDSRLAFSDGTLPWSCK